MSLRLAGGSGSEAVDLEASGDADDAGSIFAGGEVAGLLGGAGAGPVGAVAGEESRGEDLEQERGQGQVKMRGGGRGGGAGPGAGQDGKGKKPAMPESVAAASACGKLIWSGGTPMAST